MWQRVHERLDPLLLEPKVRPDVVVRELESSGHRPYFMAKSPQAGTYLRLNPRERELLALMDGSRTVKQIVLEDFATHKSLAFNRVFQLLMLLQAQSFLVGRQVPTYALVRQRLRAPRGLRARAARLIDLLLRGEICVSGIDSFVTALYRSVGRALLAWPMLVLFGILAIGGLVVVQMGRADAVPLSRFMSSEAGLVVGLAFAIFVAVSILIHELAHALTCKAFGREIRRGGFTLFFGFPAFFVDTSDIWLETRWRRIAVSAAGACADATTAGICALVALLLPPELAAVSLAFAAATYAIVLVNLFPLLALDGYYVLMDLLETPNLRPRSFAFVRESLVRKLWRRERFTREEIILATYGVLALAYTTFFVVRAVHFWNTTLAGFLADVISGGNWILIPVVVLVASLILVPLVLKLLRLARQAAGLAGRGARVLVRAAEHAQLRPRGALLAGIPALDDLPSAQLDTIAAEMRPRRYRQGSTIIRQGERGDRFFLIVRGIAEVMRTSAVVDSTRRAAAAPTRVATLGPGDYLGELALLNRAPRAATVRALTTIDVLELSADDFMRLLSPTWQLERRMQGVVELRDAVASMPLFKDLRPSERDLLLSRLRDEVFEPGEAIVRQGDEGEQFYIVREGQVRVLKAESSGPEQAVAELGPGDFFGELALLYSASRNATVLAVTPVRTWSLDRRDFDDVLRHYLRMDAVVEAAARQRFGGDPGRAADDGLRNQAERGRSRVA